ncbi:MAG: hypothetical protein JJ863_12400 [Deltaproteobacteria bacterium]|nr:hypothetical protein [Deltaproteobacteria bacterium]
MSDAPEQPTKKKNGPASMAMVVLGALIVVPMVLLVDCGHTEGQMVVEGGPHGDFVFEATDCHGLVPYGSFGANVHGTGHDDGAVYVVVDPITRAPRVQLEVPGSCQNRDGTNCTIFQVPEAACTTFEATVENTGVIVNDVRLVKGHAALECTLDDGTKVSGRVEFDGC